MNSIGRKRWLCSSSWIKKRMIKKRKSRTISWKGSKSPYWDSRSRLSYRIRGLCGACIAVPGKEYLTTSSACAAEWARAGEKVVVFQQETETATRKPKDPKQEQSTPGDLTVRCLHTAVSRDGRALLALCPSLCAHPPCLLLSMVEEIVLEMALCLQMAHGGASSRRPLV